ncbi:MAG: hypothetical protein ABIQ58_05850 [Candidatus Limnocylindrales bacterium]
MPIRLDNLTDTPVAIYVNGVWAGTYPAGASADTTLDHRVDPPYSIEVRSPSDAVLMTVDINEAQAGSLDLPGRGVADEVDVPCGVLRVIVGTLEDGTVPAPAASVDAGPCP